MTYKDIFNKKKLLEAFPVEKAKTIYKIGKCLNDVYDDNWDIFFIEDSFDIIIRFPEVKIKNSKGESHLMKEVIIKIPNIQLNDDGGIESFHEIKFSRMRASSQEVSSNYIHSHVNGDYNLNSNAKPNFIDRNPCLGNGTPIQDCRLNLIKSKTFNYNLFKTYLLYINDFVSWESLEGTRYIDISNINNTVGTQVSIMPYSECFYQFLYKKLDVDLEFYNGINVIVNDKFNKEILDNINPEYTGYRVGNGVYVMLNDRIENKVEDYSNIKFTFRGETIVFKVDYKKIEKNNLIKDVRDETKQSIKIFIEKKATRNYIKEKISQKYQIEI